MSPDHDTVARLIREVAEEEILPRFRSLAPSDIAHKKNLWDLVTTADIEAERRFSEALVALQPGSVVVGEEGTEANPELLKALAGEAPVWLVDPVDGTHNFAHGKACFAVIVAYCVGGDTVAAWIHDPTDDVTVWAAAGGGAWIRERAGTRRLKLQGARDIEDMTGSLGARLEKRLTAGWATARDPVPKRIVRYRCAGREYIDLGRSILDFARYTRLKPWDHAAGVLIHSEAGGFSQLTEERVPYCPLHGIVPGTVLLAPDRTSWHTLHALFEAAA